MRLLALCALFVAAATSTDVCSSREDGLFAAGPCAPFFHYCNGGVASIVNCTQGLYYNPDAAKCDYDYNIADCTLTTTVAPFDCSGRRNGMYAEGCTQEFWYCSGGTVARANCPGNLFFNADSQRCDYKGAITECGGQALPSGNDTEAEEGYALKINGYLPAKETTTLASDDVESTTWEFAQPEKQGDCVDKTDGDFAVGCSSTYLTCTNGLPIYNKCPAGLVFHNDGYCDYKEAVKGCEAAADVPSSTTTTILPPSTSVSYSKQTTRMNTKPTVAATTAEATTAATESHGIDCSTLANGLYSNGCVSGFVECTDGAASVRQCGNGLVFNSKRRYCDYAESCELDVLSTTTPASYGQEETTTQASTTRAATQATTTHKAMDDVEFDCASHSEGHYELGSCQNQYVSCVAGVKFVRSCPHNLVFIEKSQYCDYASSCLGGDAPASTSTEGYSTTSTSTVGYTDAVTTQSTSTEIPSTTTVASDVTNECGSREDGAYELQPCAGLFVVCTAGQAHKYYCPAGLVFIEANQHCDYPTECGPAADGSTTTPSYGGYGTSEAATTLATTLAPVEETTPANDATDCSSRPDGHYEVSPCSTQFVTCAAGVSYSNQCPDGLVFLEKQQYCDYPDACQAGESTTTPASDKQETTVPTTIGYGEETTEGTTTGYETTVAANRDCASLPDGNYETSKCSSEYVSCVAGYAYTQVCPGGLVFIEAAQYCDYAEVCETVSSSTTAASPSESPTTGYETTTQASTTSGYESSTGTTPAQDPGAFDCSGRADGYYSLGCVAEFVICSNGVVHSRTCPDGLVYSDAAKACDYATECTGGETTTTVAAGETTTTGVPETTTPSEGTTEATAGTTTQYPTTTTTDAGWNGECTEYARRSLGDCSTKFVQCKSGVWTMRRCPGQTLFDSKYLLCAYDLASCVSVPVNKGHSDETSYRPPAPAPQYTRPQPQTMCKAGHLYARGPCERTYLVCEYGSDWSVGRCPMNHRYDAHSGQCRLRFLVSGCNGQMGYAEAFSVGQQHQRGMIAGSFYDGHVGDRVEWDAWERRGYGRPGHAGSSFGDDDMYEPHVHDGFAGGWDKVYAGETFPDGGNKRIRDEWKGGRREGRMHAVFDEAKKGKRVYDEFAHFEERVPTGIHAIWPAKAQDLWESSGMEEEGVEPTVDPEATLPQLRRKRSYAVPATIPSYGSTTPGKNVVCGTGMTGQIVSIGFCRQDYVYCATEQTMLAACPVGDLFDSVTARCEAEDVCGSGSIPVFPAHTDTTTTTSAPAASPDTTSTYTQTETTTEELLTSDEPATSTEGYAGESSTVASEPSTPAYSEQVTGAPAQYIDGDDTCADRANGAYANGCSNEFIVCSNGKTYRFTCPADLVFAEKQQSCETRDQTVECGGVAPEEGQSWTTAAPAPAVPGVSSTPATPASDGTTTTGYSGPASDGTTTTGYSGSASSTPFAAQPETTQGSIPVFDCTVRADGGFGLDCTGRFVMCAHGQTHLFTCQEGLVFCEKTQACLDREQVEQCAAGATTAAVHTTRHTAVTVPAVYGQETITAGSIDFTTPAADATTTVGQKYSSGPVYGGETTPASDSSASTTSAPLSCPSDLTGLTSSGCSAEYAVCDQGVAKAVLRCPSPTKFDTTRMTCDYAENVAACSGNVPADEPSTAAPSGETTTTSTQPLPTGPSDETLPYKPATLPSVEQATVQPYRPDASPTDSVVEPYRPVVIPVVVPTPAVVHDSCDKDGAIGDKCSGIFSICSNGVASGFACAPGLVFNFDIGACDYKTNVAACAGGASDDSVAPTGSTKTDETASTNVYGETIIEEELTTAASDDGTTSVHATSPDYATTPSSEGSETTVADEALTDAYGYPVVPSETTTDASTDPTGSTYSVVPSETTDASIDPTGSIPAADGVTTDASSTGSPYGSSSSSTDTDASPSTDGPSADSSSTVGPDGSSNDAPVDGSSTDKTSSNDFDTHECVYDAEKPVFAASYCGMVYHVCSEEGVSKRAKCSPGYLFDSHVSRCVPADVCGRDFVKEMLVQMLATTVAPAKETRPDRCAGKDDGTLLPLGVCRPRYVKCVNNVTQPQQCGRPAEVFSASRGGCVLKMALAECQEKRADTYTQPALEEEEDLEKFCLTARDGLYRHPEKCAGIIQCFGGEMYVYSDCPSGLVFNERSAQCDYRANVPECDEPANDDTDGCEGHEHGAYMADPSDCSVFYRCVWTRKERMTCPATTVFNPALSVCDWPSEVPSCEAKMSDEGTVEVQAAGVEQEGGVEEQTETGVEQTEEEQEEEAEMTGPYGRFRRSV